LATIAFSGTTYAAQEGETIVITEELTKLINLYKEGVITEEEFSKAKSILLNPDSDISKKKKIDKKKLTAVERRDLEELEKEELKAAKKAKKIKKKKQKLTAVERRDLEELEKEELKAAKKAEREELKAAKEAERERKSEERKRQAEEEELARLTCKDNPEVKCPSTVLGTLKKLNIFKKN
jgi:hypothetical protein